VRGFLERIVNQFWSLFIILFLFSYLTLEAELYKLNPGAGVRGGERENARENVESTVGTENRVMTRVSRKVSKKLFSKSAEKNVSCKSV
jgi:hypothetical protein